MTLPPNLVAKIDHINHYELPTVTGMIEPDGAIGPDYHRIMLDELHAQAVAGNAEALWALEVIAGLYERWIETTELIQRVRDVLDE